MDGARITIGGLDVSPSLDDTAASALPGAGDLFTAGSERARPQYVRGHAPVTLAVTPARRQRCPIPAGPWRVIGAIAVLGLLFSLIAVLRGCPRRTG